LIEPLFLKVGGITPLGIIKDVIGDYIKASRGNHIWFVTLIAYKVSVSIEPPEKKFKAKLTSTLNL
jgi:hypothetical protein